MGNFPGTSSDFPPKSGGHVRNEKSVKKVVFRPKNADFLANFHKILKITRNHLITQFDQISGHFEHFRLKMAIFRSFLAIFANIIV